MGSCFGKCKKADAGEAVEATTDRVGASAMAEIYDQMGDTVGAQEVNLDWSEWPKVPSRPQIISAPHSMPGASQVPLGHKLKDKFFCVDGICMNTDLGCASRVVLQARADWERRVQLECRPPPRPSRKGRRYASICANLWVALWPTHACSASRASSRG